jgi:hypothetical protein
MRDYQLPLSKCIAMMKLLAFCLFIISLINIPIAEARIRHYKWEIKYEYRSPDCYKKLVITINGRTPGPTIFAQQNDTVIVEVKNNLLTENTAIHWHGIRQIGTPWFDGTEGVTQCPVLPGDTFVYKFVVDRVSSLVLALIIAGVLLMSAYTYNKNLLFPLCSLVHICTMHIMECKEKLGYMVRFA